MSPVPPKRPGAPPPRRRRPSQPVDPVGEELEPAPEGEPVEPASADGTLLDVSTEGLDLDGGGDPQAGNATVVFNTNTGARKGAAAASTAKLIVLKGPKQGAEFTLGPGETSIGRNADNTVVIPDISVSRRHVVLVKQADGYLLQDQGSGNGTLVNGSQAGEHPLVDGDVFSIGDTEIQYAVVGASTRSRSSASVPVATPARHAPSRASGPVSRASPGRALPPADVTGRISLPAEGLVKKRSKTPILAAIGGVVVLGGLGLLYKAKVSGIQQAQQAQQVAQAQAQVEAAGALYNEGKAFAAQGKWTEALAKFTDAKAQGCTEGDLDEYLSRATKETENQKLLQASSDALGKGQLALAWETVNKVPPESLLSDKSQDLQKQIKAAIPTRITDARGKIALKDFPAASAILDDLAKVDPSDATITAAQDELAKAQDKPAPVHYTAHATVVDHSNEVVAAFKSGDLKRAKDIAAQYSAGDEHVKLLAERLGDFETAYNALDTDKNAFKRAQELDTKISHGQSAFTAKINAHALAIYLKQGAVAKSAGHLGEAYRAFQAAHKAEPGNAEANTQLADLKAKAKDMYLAGYVKASQDPDGARQLFQQVISITPPDDESHQKAERKLKDLGN